MDPSFDHPFTEESGSIFFWREEADMDSEMHPTPLNPLGELEQGSGSGSGMESCGDLDLNRYPFMVMDIDFFVNNADEMLRTVSLSDVKSEDMDFDETLPPLFENGDDSELSNEPVFGDLLSDEVTITPMGTDPGVKGESASTGASDGYVYAPIVVKEKVARRPKQRLTGCSQNKDKMHLNNLRQGQAATVQSQQVSTTSSSRTASIVGFEVPRSLPIKKGAAKSAPKRRGRKGKASRGFLYERKKEECKDDSEWTKVKRAVNTKKFHDRRNRKLSDSEHLIRSLVPGIFGKLSAWQKKIIEVHYPDMFQSLMRG